MRGLKIWLKKKRMPWSKRQWVDAYDLYLLCMRDPSYAASIVMRIENQQVKEVFTSFVVRAYAPQKQEAEDCFLSDVAMVFTCFAL